MFHNLLVVVVGSFINKFFIIWLPKRSVVKKCFNKNQVLLRRMQFR
jgi:hypothetical protein